MEGLCTGMRNTIRESQSALGKCCLEPILIHRIINSSVGVNKENTRPKRLRFLIRIK